ncbi:MAG: hypothetical protein M5U01_26555 [Ardenticatenaceae bacterium]|nr:hypothetical protein [Ardenticatenaceae bacterium]
MRNGATQFLASVSVGQGIFYLITGLWPLVNIRTFQMVTGAKTDLWLVRTVGVLITVIGAVLTVAGLRRNITPASLLLAAGSAAGLTGIDIVYVARGRIARVYLLERRSRTQTSEVWEGWCWPTARSDDGDRGGHRLRTRLRKSLPSPRGMT